jgi:hypothetical protein
MGGQEQVALSLGEKVWVGQRRLERRLERRRERRRVSQLEIQEPHRGDLGQAGMEPEPEGRPES